MQVIRRTLRQPPKNCYGRKAGQVTHLRAFDIFDNLIRGIVVRTVGYIVITKHNHVFNSNLSFVLQLLV